jgi:hypothetical protein
MIDFRRRSRVLEEAPDRDRGGRVKKIGGYLLFFGIGSIVLHFVHLQFILLSWISYWGDMTAWEIRIGMAALGAVMVWWAKRNEFQ